MGCESIYVEADSRPGACLFCNTTNVVFGPVFEDCDEVVAFIVWLKKTHNEDPRQYDTPQELVARISSFHARTTLPIDMTHPELLVYVTRLEKELGLVRDKKPIVPPAAQYPCLECGGDGKVRHQPFTTCSDCKGSGVV